MQVQGIINGVAPRAAGGTTIYDIDLGGQVYSTFDPEMMRLANDHVGQVVIAEVEVKPSKNGQFTNYFFNGIPAAGPPQQSLSPAPQPMQPQPMPQLMGPPAESQADKEARISFLSVLQSASRLVGHVYEGAGPELLVEAEEQATTLAKTWFKKAMQAPAVARRDAAPPAALQAVPEPAPQPEPTEVPVSTEIPDW